MKRIEKEVVTKTTRIIFEAYDGEQFSNVDDCNAYENNAKGVLGKKVQLFRIARTNEYELFSCFGVGSEDYDVEVYRPQTAKDIETLNQYMNMYYDKAELVPDDYIGKEVIVNFNYDKDWCSASTLDELIERFKKNFAERILKEEKKDGE